MARRKPLTLHSSGRLRRRLIRALGLKAEMTSLVIHRWVPELGWAGPNSWSFAAFCARIQQCTLLRGTELKRVARRVMKGDAVTLELVSAESASALLHTLESLGAQVSIQ
jgi:hypothetical protein